MAWQDRRGGDAAGPGETLFYGLAVLLAAAPLDLLAATSDAAGLLRAACWAMVYAIFAVLLLVHARPLGALLWRNALLLTLPLLGLASVAWSSDPARTAVASLQVLSVVLFGTLIGLRLGRGAIPALVLLALLPVAMAAAVMSAMHPLGVDINGDAVGVFSHKNTLGNRAAIMGLAAAALLLAGRLRLAAAVGLVLALGLLAASGSRTAWVAAATAAPALLAARVVRLSPGAATLAVAAAGVAACALAALLVSGLFDPMRLFFQTLDRDPTLTGRTVLWEMALAYIREAPLAGHGFDAFWDHDSLTSDAAYVAVTMRQELPHFHNAYLEMAVQLGWTGALLMAAVTVLLFQRTLRLAHTAVAADGAFALGLMALVAVSDMVEVALIQRHGLALMILSALAAQAVREAPQAAAAKAPLAQGAT